MHCGSAEVKRKSGKLASAPGWGGGVGLGAIIIVRIPTSWRWPSDAASPPHPTTGKGQRASKPDCAACRRQRQLNASDIGPTMLRVATRPFVLLLLLVSALLRSVLPCPVSRCPSHGSSTESTLTPKSATAGAGASGERFEPNRATTQPIHTCAYLASAPLSSMSSRKAAGAHALGLAASHRIDSAHGIATAHTTAATSWVVATRVVTAAQGICGIAATHVAKAHGVAGDHVAPHPFRSPQPMTLVDLGSV